MALTRIQKAYIIGAIVWVILFALIIALFIKSIGIVEVFFFIFPVIILVFSAINVPNSSSIVSQVLANDINFEVAIIGVLFIVGLAKTPVGKEYFLLILVSLILSIIVAIPIRVAEAYKELLFSIKSIIQIYAIMIVFYVVIYLFINAYTTVNKNSNTDGNPLFG